MSGPLPSTNTRKLFTPGVRGALKLPPSANPSPSGITPPIKPTAGPVEHTSNVPEQSAKLIIIEGVGPSAAGLVNSPCVNCSKLTAPGWNDADTAAYTTLHGPVAIAVTLPNVVALPE